MPAFVGNKINRFVPVTQIADKHLVLLLLLDISSENYYYQLNIKWVVYKYYFHMGYANVLFLLLPPLTAQLGISFVGGWSNGLDCGQWRAGH